MSGNLLRYACCKVFGHVQDECPKHRSSDVAKNLKNPSQALKGFPVGPKVGFQPIKQVFRPISKKNNGNTSGNKKKYVESRKEVSNTNLFDVLISVENDVVLGTNRGTLNLASKEVVSSGSSFWNVESSSPTYLVDDERKPLKRVGYPGDHDSDDEVVSVDNDMTCFQSLERVRFGTNSLLEQWTYTYENVDYEYDTYDDDTHEGYVLTYFNIYIR
ncbi:hypothetical protein Tco_0950233 [Tanacetum coccineum]